jgi:hypothetical protein
MRLSCRDCSRSNYDGKKWHHRCDECPLFELGVPWNEVAFKVYQRSTLVAIETELQKPTIKQRESLCLMETADRYDREKGTSMIQEVKVEDLLTGNDASGATAGPATVGQSPADLEEENILAGNDTSGTTGVLQPWESYVNWDLDDMEDIPDIVPGVVAQSKSGEQAMDEIDEMVLRYLPNAA